MVAAVGERVRGVGITTPAAGRTDGSWSPGRACVPFGPCPNSGLAVFEGDGPVVCASKEEMLLVPASGGWSVALWPAYEEAKYSAWRVCGREGNLL